MNVPMKPRSLLAALLIGALTATGALAADKITVPNEKPVAAASCTALTTSGWVWPTIIGPQEPM